MAIPALRQPKIILDQGKAQKSLPHNKNYVIITLRDEKKLVIAADSYNGIISMGGAYKCIFCGDLLALDQTFKEKHIHTSSHSNTMDKHPHLEEFSHNLIRKLDNCNTYCTICNVVVDNIQLMKHIDSEPHLQELERASTRALTYKPTE